MAPALIKEEGGLGSTKRKAEDIPAYGSDVKRLKSSPSPSPSPVVAPPVVKDPAKPVPIPEKVGSPVDCYFLCCKGLY